MEEELEPSAKEDFKTYVYKLDKNQPPRIFNSDNELWKNLTVRPKEIFNISKIVSEFGEEIETVYFLVKYHKGKIKVKFDGCEFEGSRYNK